MQPAPRCRSPLPSHQALSQRRQRHRPRQAALSHRRAGPGRAALSPPTLTFTQETAGLGLGRWVGVRGGAWGAREASPEGCSAPRLAPRPGPCCERSQRVLSGSPGAMRSQAAGGWCTGSVTSVGRDRGGGEQGPGLRPEGRPEGHTTLRRTRTLISSLTTPPGSPSWAAAGLLVLATRVTQTLRQQSGWVSPGDQRP